MPQGQEDLYVNTPDPIRQGPMKKPVIPDLTGPRYAYIKRFIGGLVKYVKSPNKTEGKGMGARDYGI